MAPPASGQLTKRDVEDTARGAVQALLGEPGLDRRTRQARADSLLLYGEVFGRAKGFDSAVRHPRDLVVHHRCHCHHHHHHHCSPSTLPAAASRLHPQPPS